MRKILLSLLVLVNISKVSVFSQIKMAQFPGKEKKEIIFNYDSLTNVKEMKGEEWNDRFKHLIGQKIMSVSSDNSHVCTFYGAKSWANSDSIKSIENKVFLITSVEGYTFTLQEEKSPNHIIKISVNSDFSWVVNQSWICLGYYDKIKDLYLGKELVYINNDYDDKNGDYYVSLYPKDRFMDYNTKRNLTKKIPCNSVWKCTDVLVLPGKLNFGDCDDRVILNIENEKYGKYYIFASKLFLNKEWKHEMFLSMEDFHKYQAVQNQLRAEAKAKAAKAAAEAAKREAERRNRIISEYGEHYGYMILRGEVTIGMTKQQCLEALGNPQRINRTTTSSIVYEQWVYVGKYLYFENGKLVTIQD